MTIDCVLLGDESLVLGGWLGLELLKSNPCTERKRIFLEVNYITVSDYFVC